MNQTDLCFTPAVQLAGMIRERQISPVEVVDAVLDRIERLNPALNAFLVVDGDGARAAARQAEAAVMAGADLGPLHGVPVSIKDMEPTAGLPCTYGSLAYAGHIAEHDGLVSERVRSAGGIILGKTNTPHFGHKDTCENLLGPPGCNPWNVERTPGGSSGGAAAAVASGLGPLAHGTDGAGSIRIPAALCGVFGLKPSFGRVPYWPNVDIWSARSHSGPLTRTVADGALMLSVIAGPDPRDPTTIDALPDDYVAAVSQPYSALKGLRVAWSPDLGYAPVDPEVAGLTQAAAQAFADFGCRVEEMSPGWDNLGPSASRAWDVSFAARLGEQYDQQPQWFESTLAQMIRAGRRLSGPEAVATSIERTRFYNQVLAFFQDFDLLITPQMPVVAWPIEEPPSRINGVATPSMFDRLPFTFPFNLTGQPAASVPCGFSSQGLPVAIQIVGRWHADTLVLQAAAAFEAARPWQERKPSFP